MLRDMHDLRCFLGETIGDTFDLPPVIIKHFSRSSVCCMLSKRISSISSLIESEMTQNSTTKYVKFLFCATLLIIGNLSNHNGDGNENVTNVHI